MGCKMHELKVLQLYYVDNNKVAKFLEKPFFICPNLKYIKTQNDKKNTLFFLEDQMNLKTGP